MLEWKKIKQNTIQEEVADEELADMFRLEKEGEAIEKFRRAVNDNFSVADSRRIFRALDFMIELHLSQKDRQDNSPYISHPLAVAADIINKYRIYDCDLVISALLHDAVEDQSYKIYRLLKRKELGREPGKAENLQYFNKDNKKRIKSGILTEINRRFGGRVRETIERVTNPDFNDLIAEFGRRGIKKSKNELYKEHTAKIIKNRDACVVKYADFARNALALDRLPESPKKKYFRRKYGPVIRDVFRPLFKKLPSGHPLFRQKEKIIGELEKAYREQYG